MTAMRIGEAGLVRWRDIDLSGGSILIRSGKTNESARRIAMTSELRTHVQRHLQRQRARGLADPDTPVFCTKHANPILEQQANRVLKRLAIRAGISKNISCHALRRSWAMHAVTLISIEAVAAHLGHATGADYRRPLRPRAIPAGGSRDPEGVRVTKMPDSPLKGFVKRSQRLFEQTLHDRLPLHHLNPNQDWLGCSVFPLSREWPSISILDNSLHPLNKGEK